MITRAQATPRTRSDSLGYVFMLLSATGVVFLPTPVRLAFEAGNNLLAVMGRRGVIATLIWFENRARGRT